MKFCRRMEKSVVFGRKKERKNEKITIINENWFLENRICAIISISGMGGNGNMAYFPVFINLSGKHVVVIGGGRIAERRIAVLLEFGCRITVIAPELSDGLRKMRSDETNHIIWKEKKYETADLTFSDQEEMPVFVLAAACKEVNDRAVVDCHEKKIPVNHASDRDQCDFYFPGIAKDGETVVGITSGGTSHRLAAELSGAIRTFLKETWKV